MLARRNAFIRNVCAPPKLTTNRCCCCLCYCLSSANFNSIQADIAKLPASEKAKFDKVWKKIDGSKAACAVGKYRKTEDEDACVDVPKCTFKSGPQEEATEAPKTAG